MAKQQQAHNIALVAVETLHQDPANPRRITEREMDRLKRSIQADPDFMKLRPILARPDGSIYAGNMRFAAAVALGWTEVPAIITDDPEAVVRTRAVKDNTQFGEWVEEELAEYLHDLGEMEPDLDLGAMGLEDHLVRSMGLEDIVVDLPPIPPPLAEEASGGGKGAGGLPRPDFNEAADESSRTLEQAPSQLEGVLQLAEDALFPGLNPWDIPDLREDMLLDRAPEPLMCWSDQKTTPPRDDMFYLWNWGLAPSTNLPMDRALLCFYTHDFHFENWWSLPHFYTAKVLNAGIKMAVVPDFSIYAGHPKVVQLNNVFRAQWMGRYLQEAGIKVVPRLNWGMEDSWGWCFYGIPKNPPVAAICIQTFLTQPKVGGWHDGTEWTKAKAEAFTVDGLRAALEIVQPQSLINYGGNPAHELVRSMNLDIPVQHVMNYSGVRRGVAFDRGSAHSDSPLDAKDNPNLHSTGAFME